MKKVFKVFGLSEQSLLEDVSLSNEGVRVYKVMSVLRHHQGDFDSEFEALKFINTQIETSDYEHGFEIIEVFVKN